MSDDPLAAYRRERWQANETKATGQQPVAEHQALRLAIDALNQIPNASLTGEYSTTYELIPVLEKSYRGAEPEIGSRTQEASAPEPGRTPEPDIELER